MCTGTMGEMGTTGVTCLKALWAVYIHTLVLVGDGRVMLLIFLVSSSLGKSSMGSSRSAYLPVMTAHGDGLNFFAGGSTDASTTFIFNL